MFKNFHIAVATATLAAFTDLAHSHGDAKQVTRYDALRGYAQTVINESTGIERSTR